MPTIFFAVAVLLLEKSDVIPDTRLLNDDELLSDEEDEEDVDEEDEEEIDDSFSFALLIRLLVDCAPAVVGAAMIMAARAILMS